MITAHRRIALTGCILISSIVLTGCAKPVGMPRHEELAEQARQLLRDNKVEEAYRLFQEANRIAPPNRSTGFFSSKSWSRYESGEQGARIAVRKRGEEILAEARRLPRGSAEAAKAYDEASRLAAIAAVSWHNVSPSMAERIEVEKKSASYSPVEVAAQMDAVTTRLDHLLSVPPSQENRSMIAAARAAAAELHRRTYVVGVESRDQSGHMAHPSDLPYSELQSRLLAWIRAQEDRDQLIHLLDHHREQDVTHRGRASLSYARITTLWGVALDPASGKFVKTGFAAAPLPPVARTPAGAGAPSLTPTGDDPDEPYARLHVSNAIAPAP